MIRMNIPIDDVIDLTNDNDENTSEDRSFSPLKQQNKSNKIDKILSTNLDSSGKVSYLLIA